MQTNLLTSACMHVISLSLPCPSLYTHAPLALSPVSARKQLSLPWEDAKHMGKRDGITAGTHAVERDGGPSWKEQRKMPMHRALQGKRNFLRRRQKRTRGSTTRSTSAVRWFLEEDDGEAESAKSEMMVASSVLL